MNWLLFFVVLAQIESGGNAKAWNRSEDARGMLQIRNCVIIDVNERYGFEYTHNDAFDHRKARAICAHYLKRYGADQDYEKAFRTWNGGPDGPRQQCTEEYWKKAERLLRVLEKHGRN